MVENTEKPKFDIFELGAVHEVVTRFGGVKLLEEMQYETPPIPVFGEQCPNPEVTKSHVLRHPAIYSAKVQDFKVIGGAAFPIIEDKSICHQNFSTEYWETSEQAIQCCDIRQDQHLLGYCNIKARHQYPYKVINLVGNGSYNFAHWMTEYLPQVVLLKKAGIDLSEYKVLVDARSFPSMLEALYLLGITVEQLVKVDEMTLNAFPEALWVSPVANVVFQRPHAICSDMHDKLTEPFHSTFHPQVIRMTRDFFIGLLVPQLYEKAPEKIFIKRFSGRRFHSRAIVNEYVIQRKLESEGFVSIDPSQLTFIEQVRMFSKAKYIVGASGAALLNMIWAPVGAKVVVLMNDSKVANYWYFSNIAFAVGHQLSYVLGKIVNTGNWSDIHHADFEIALEAVVMALESAGFQFSVQPEVDIALSNLLETAGTYYREGDLENAEKIYLNILEIAPEHAEANYRLGLLESVLYGESVAVVRLERAVLAKPEEEKYWISYIESLMQAGALDVAADALELGMKYGLKAITAQKLAERYADNFNLDRIGFLVHTLELVNHYACVWSLLPEGSFDVLLCGEATSSGTAVCFKDANYNILNAEKVIESAARYQYLVSNHPIDLTDAPLIKRLGTTNVRFMYAAGKSGWNLSEWNKLYDVIFCFGPYHAAKFSDSTEAVVLQMGYPRFDRYFTQQVDRGDLLARYGCDSLKQTVVWLPTWKALSSVTHYDAEISALTDRYNVVIKLHPLMPESEPERVQALLRHHFTHVITDTTDNLPLYQLADFMLFDYGGPPLAAIYTDKNLILLNVDGAGRDSLTGEDSPDITIRKHLVNVNPGDMAIAALLADPSIWEQQRAVRHALRKTYFAPYYGFSSQVAASALLNLKHIAEKSGAY
ncbi:MAG: hypothetical protein CVU29_04300 [Betaproteobacteria bacterium HGW-Betaproteobacteria-22]|nr:MAG: hypothetical protein CVU29_04300 [Betaproteobacteria bacterium HGW-Betaproteobacteria-22]